MNSKKKIIEIKSVDSVLKSKDKISYVMNDGNLIINKGKEFNLSHCGMFAMDTMRMEKDTCIGVMIYLQKKINMKQG